MLTKCLQELQIPHVCISTSEIDEEYRLYHRANNPGIHHQHKSMDDQLKGRPCALHPEASCCCISPSPELLVVGAPCNPFSAMRAKRFHENSVMAHQQTRLTFEGVFSLMKTFNPVTMTVETTDGFHLPLEKGSTRTPYNLPLV